MIREIAKRDELRSLFIRTDNRGPAKSLTEPEPVAEAWTKSGREALVEVMAAHPNVPNDQARRRLELTNQALPFYDPRRQLADRAAELRAMKYPPYETAESVGAGLRDIY
jgi:hypothetical protein